MIRLLYLATGIALFSVAAVAQKIPLINSGEVIDRGKQKYDSGKYDEAIALYRSVPKRDTNYVYMLTELAMTYAANKNYTEAIATCDQILEKPSTFRAHVLRTKASALDSKGEFEKAVAALQTAQEEFPFEVSLIYNLGITYYNHKDYDKAIDYFFKALSINPFHSGSHLMLGMVAARLGRKTHALLAFGLYLGVNNTDNARLIFIDRFVSNQYTEEGSITDFGAVNDCEKMDQIIRARIAMDEKFKIKVQMDVPVVRQYEMFFEQLSTLPVSGKDRWVNQYLPFYNTVKEQGLTEPFLYHILASVDNANVKKWRQKNEKQLNAFYGVGNTAIAKPRLVLKVPEKFGYDGPVSAWYDDDNRVEALGAKNANSENDGQWYYFHTSKHLSGEGKFKAGKKTGIWKYYYPEGTLKKNENNETGEVTSFFSTGEKSQHFFLKENEIHGDVELFHRCGGLQEKLKYEKGKRNGPGQSFYPNGQKELTYTYTNDLANGEFVRYYENGQLASRINYKDDQLHGTYTKYYTNGKTMMDGAYLNGEVYGNWKYYHSNGRLEKTGKYEKDMAVGEWKYYDADGTLNETRVFDAEGNWQGDNTILHNGKPHHTQTFKKDLLVKMVWHDQAGKERGAFGNDKGTFAAKTFYPSGKLNGEGAYQKGKLHGTWKYYYHEGNLLSEYTYVDGKNEGSGAEYFRNGKTKMTFTYKDNELHGYFQEFHPNGQVKQEGWFQNGQRQQQWFTYFPDGKVDSDYYYLNDELTGIAYDYSGVGLIFTENEYENGKIVDLKNFNEKGVLSSTVRSEENRKIYEDKASTGKILARFEIQCGDYVNQVYRGYPDGGTFYSYGLLNGNRHGKHIYYGLENKPMIRGQYEYGDRNGLWEGDLMPGKLEYRGRYVDGEYDSLWTYYMPWGGIASTAWYKNGNRHGVTRYNGPDAKPLVEKLFDDGNFLSYRVVGSDGTFGAWTTFDKDATIVANYPNGTKAYEETYKNGVMDGAKRIYHPNGTLYMEYLYREGSSEGPYKEFYPNGKPLERGTYTNDELNGVYEIFNEDGTPYLTETYVNGLREGKSTLYKNGRIVKEVLFSGNNPRN